MSKGIILFQSKYGATKKYADWLAEKTGYACVETKNANAVDLKPYDVILLGGGVYASGIAGFQFLKKNISQLADKKIYMKKYVIAFFLLHTCLCLKSKGV